MRNRSLQKKNKKGEDGLVNEEIFTPHNTPPSIVEESFFEKSHLGADPNIRRRNPFNKSSSLPPSDYVRFGPHHGKLKSDL